MLEHVPSDKLYSYWRYGENIMEPVGPVAIIAQQTKSELADSLNRKFRRSRQTFVSEYPELEAFPGYLRREYRIPVDLRRFASGEGQATILESVRGHDLFIVTDVLNHGTYTQRFNQLQSLSPDDHFQDLVRIISATHGICKRINVIMPFLYEGRRYQRHNRASMDCAQMLRELFSLGISNFITFDAHDPRVANAVPRMNFESFPTVLPILKCLLKTVPDLELNRDKFMIISPKETGISKAIYYASMMRVPLGTFYRTIAGDGSVGKSFLGDPVEGRDVLIVDDMIDSGKTIIECSAILKDLGAKRVFVAASYTLLSSGYEGINQAYDFGQIEKIFSTNLSYLPRALQDMPWFEAADMSGNIAHVINAINHNDSLSALLRPEAQIDALIQSYPKAKGD